MGISFLNLLGFYEYDIEQAYKQCEEALQTTCLESELDGFEDRIRNSLRYANSDFWNEPTNGMINIMFQQAANIITVAYPGMKTDYYVNGCDSHFYLKDDDLFRALREAGIKPDAIKRIMEHDLMNALPLNNDSEVVRLASDEDLVDTFIDVFETGNEVIIFDSFDEFKEELKHIEEHNVYFIRDDGSVVTPL